MPTLSIIVPVYNKVEYIDACINSILSQTFKDFELLLINDGSTDGSELKCDGYRKLDTRVKVFDQENKGVSFARNLGLQNASGQFIGFIDSDDIIDTDMYAILINNAIKYKADISICGMETINSVQPGKQREKKVNTKVFNRNEAVSLYLKGAFETSANNKIYKVEIAKKNKFEGVTNEDILYSFLAFIQADTFVFEDLPKYKYLLRANSVSMSKFGVKHIEMIRTSKKILDIVSKNSFIHINDAKAFDFSANISLLNLLLLVGEEKYKEEYKNVCNNLHKYSTFLKEKSSITNKQRYAYYIFKINPKIYSFFMYLYCSFYAKARIKITESS